MSASEGVKDSLGPWLELFDDYRISSFPHDEVVFGTLRPGFDAGHPSVVRALEGWSGRAHLGQRDDGVYEVALVREIGPKPRDHAIVHVVLFLLVVLSTLVAGALLTGAQPFRPPGEGGSWLARVDWSAIWRGVPFAATLLLILGAHEMAHYAVAMKHRVKASLPYFIPIPAVFSLVGTFGAFIRIKGPVVRRSVLFDIGIAGPLASFVLSVGAVWVGLVLSGPSGFRGTHLMPFLVFLGDQPIGLGSSIFTYGLATLHHDVFLGLESLSLHPVAFAGWVGLLLTSLNLLPFGQLDGGHVLYGLMGEGQRWVARIFVILLVPLGLVWWGWWLWGIIALALSRGRLDHPPVLQPEHRLDRTRRFLGLVAVVIFWVTFMPIPLALFV